MEKICLRLNTFIEKEFEEFMSLIGQKNIADENLKAKF